MERMDVKRITSSFSNGVDVDVAWNGAIALVAFIKV